MRQLTPLLFGIMRATYASCWVWISWRPNSNKARILLDPHLSFMMQLLINSERAISSSRPMNYGCKRMLECRIMILEQNLSVGWLERPCTKKSNLLDSYCHSSAKKDNSIEKTDFACLVFSDSNYTITIICKHPCTP